MQRKHCETCANWAPERLETNDGWCWLDQGGGPKEADEGTMCRAWRERKTAEKEAHGDA